MGIIGLIIGFILVGLIAGFAARALMPGKDSMSIGKTIMIGGLGSLLGGFLAYFIFGADAEKGAVQLGGLFSSIVGAFIVLFLYNKFGKSRGL